MQKKKFYNFVQNLPLFIPHEKISVTFSNLIDKYPVSPYLDNKDTLVRWFHFIHNTINKNMGKPSISLADSLDKYYYNYKPQEELKKEWITYIKRTYICCYCCYFNSFHYLSLQYIR